jgi:hypothetical protein
MIGTMGTFSPNLSRPVMGIKVILPANDLQHHVIYIQKELLSISFPSKNDTFCQLFVGQLTRFTPPTPHSIDSDVRSDFIYLTYYAVLLSIILAAFCVLGSIKSDGI